MVWAEKIACETMDFIILLISELCTIVHVLYSGLFPWGANFRYFHG